MKHLVAALLLSTALAGPAEAAGAGYQEKLIFVAPTEIPGDNGEMLALCHLVKDHTALFIPIHRSSIGYALAENNCDSENYFALEPAKMRQAQLLGMIGPSIPSEPSIGTMWTIGNYVVYGIGGFFGLAGLYAMVTGKGKRNKPVAGQRVARGRRDQLLTAVVDVMCYVAMVDGDVDQNEITEITRIYRQLTNTAIPQAKIAEQFSQIAGPIDIANMASAFDQKEREILLQAAMMIAVADGKIEPAEHQFIGDLAEGFGLSGDHVRAILQKLVAEKNGGGDYGAGTPQPA